MAPNKMIVLMLAASVETMIAASIFRQPLVQNYLSTFLVFLSLQFVAVAAYRTFIYPFFRDPLRHLPQPKGGRFLLGHGLTALKRPRGEPYIKWMNEIPNDGILYFRGFLNRGIVVITDTKALSEILVTKSYDFEKPRPIRNFLRDILGDGLIIVEGDQHAFLRKNLLPAFSYRQIKNLYLPVFWRKAVEMTAGVRAEVAAKQSMLSQDSSAVVEVNHHANLATLDIIGLAAMGRDFNCLRNGQDPLTQNYEELLEPTKEKGLYYVANIMLGRKLVNMLPWKLNQRVSTITSNLASIALDLVREKKSITTGETDDKKDILATLIRSNNFSDDQLADQVLTFLAAGHETTSSAFTFTTYLLASHPEIQTALRQEISAHIPSPLPTDFDLATVLDSLPLLNGVCNEAHRLYPAIPLTVRVAVKDTTLVDVKIPRNTELFIVPWATNRNPKLWGPDAAKFSPERWIDTDEKTGKQRPNNSGGAQSNFAFLTFLHGPRSCIGQGFAKAELKCLTAAFVAAFEMEMADPNEKIVPQGVLTTKPEKGMHLRLRPLDE